MSEKYAKDGWIQIRAPRELTEALKQAAQAHGMTASAYTRAALERRVRQDARAMRRRHADVTPAAA